MQDVYTPRKRKHEDDEAPSPQRYRLSLHRDFVLGCKHRQHAVQIWTPCCEKLYPCVLCHDETEGHSLDYTQVTTMLCVVCAASQPLGPTCVECHAVLARYFCAPCLIWDRFYSNFHCSRCEHCHPGSPRDYRYCPDCRSCLPRVRFYNHYHLVRPYQKPCAICQEGPLHRVAAPVHLPVCNHALHQSCYDQLMRVDYRCPTCRMSIGDTSELFQLYDLERELNPTPRVYRYPVKIYCNDCRKNSETLNNFIQLQCTLCGSYNVSRAT